MCFFVFAVSLRWLRRAAAAARGGGGIDWWLQPGQWEQILSVLDVPDVSEFFACFRRFRYLFVFFDEVEP